MTNRDGLEKRFQQPDTWQWNAMVNSAGASLRYGGLTPPPGKKPLAHILYVEGLSESAEQSFEIARDFQKRGCGFWALDRMGQGKSGRLLGDQFRQHARDFRLDAADLLQMIKTVIPQDAPVFILAHSTGGLIALEAVKQDKDKSIRGVMMTSPLFGLMHPVMKDREHFFAKLKLPRKLKERYAIGSADWAERGTKDAGLDPQDFSSDPVRMLVHDQLMKNDPTLQIGGPTFGWVHTVCQTIARVRTPEYLKSIDRPLLIFTAGKDVLANNKHTFNSVAHLPQADLRHFGQGKHELLMETDDIRTPIIKSTMAFIRKLA